MTPLRQRMIREMQLRQFSQRTVESYVDAVAGLANHYQRSPDQLALEEVRSYLQGSIKGTQLFYCSDRPADLPPPTFSLR